MFEKLYVVKSGDHAPRIISAPNKAAALRHVAQATFAVSMASHAELIALTKGGVEVEHATVVEHAKEAAE